MTEPMQKIYDIKIFKTGITPGNSFPIRGVTKQSLDDLLLAHKVANSMNLFRLFFSTVNGQGQEGFSIPYLWLKDATVFFRVVEGEKSLDLGRYI